MEKTTSSRKRWQRVLLWIAIYVAVWTVLAVLDSVGTYVAQLRFDKPISWALAFRRQFEEVYTSAVLVAGILWLCGRIRFEPGRLRRWLLIHIPASFVFSIVFLMIISWWWTGEISVQTGKVLTFSYLFHMLAISYGLANVFKYWAVVLIHLGWQFYRRYRERERQAAALATELVQARLQALRMQINPHFLFNTLNMISSLIHENPDAADRMVVRLSELLRHTFERGDTQEVPLREEIKFLQGYLEIQQMRFGNRLTVDIRVEPDAQDVMVPFLLLQPLVENAIRHGIEPREEPGRIEIAAHRDGDRLELRVKDNGDGLPAEQLREGVGLANTRSRLMHLYDEEASFDLVNAPGGGLEVRVRLPARTTVEPFQPKVVIMSRKDLPADVLPQAP
jgi:two-component system, LytTR family, sensor kinase